MKFVLRKILCNLFFVVFLFQIANSQEFVQNDQTITNKNKGFDINKFFFGGGFGLNFGTESIITINPEVGYRFTDKFSAGVGISYNYYSYNRVPKFSTNIYGGNIFSSYIRVYTE